MRENFEEKIGARNPIMLRFILCSFSFSSYTWAATSLNQLHTPSSPPLSRSLSAPSTLDQRTTVQEGIHDVRRLQRWRANVQRKHSRCAAEDQTDCDVNVRTFVSTVAEIFAFIGSDPDKAVSREYSVDMASAQMPTHAFRYWIF